MLDTINEKVIHQQCIDRLLTKVYKFMNGYSTDILNDVFHLRQNTYNLQNFHAFATDVPRNNCMLNSVFYRANQLWEIIIVIIFIVISIAIIVILITRQYFFTCKIFILINVAS